MAEAVERFRYGGLFQRRLVQVLFQDIDFTITIAPYLQPSYFENRVHRWFGRTIIDHTAKNLCGVPADAMPVLVERAYVSGQLQRKRDEADVKAMLKVLRKKVADRSFIKEEVFRFVKNQVVKESVLNTVEHLKAGDFSAVDRELERALDVKMAFSTGLGHSLVADRNERYKRRINYEPDGVPTGFRLDEYMKPGGLPPKQLGAVIAPPSGGKTNTLINIGKAAVMEGQTPVLHVSLELARNVIEDRYDACFTGVKVHELETGDNPKAIRTFWRSLGEELGGEPVVIEEFPARTLTVPALKAFIRQLERKAFYPGLILVDYADLLVPTAPETGNKYIDVGNVYIELRAMAQELNVPIWTAGQGNRESLGKAVLTMRDLADSFQKAMHSDVLIALCQTEAEKKGRKGRFFMMKNRNGTAEFEVPIKLDWTRAKIHNR